MVREMTSGRPISLILSFSVPLLLGNIFQQFYNMVDTLIVGKFVGANALGAVGSTGSVSFLIIGFVLGIASGFSILVAQAFGRGDQKSMRKYVVNAFYLSMIIAVLLTVITMVFTRPILELMQTPANIIEDAYNYIIIIFAGIIVVMLYNFLSGILRALGDSKTPLYFLAIAAILNIVLDLLFIVGFGMSVTGAALATVISQAISVILCIVYIKRNFEMLKFTKEDCKIEPKMCKDLIKIGVPMALQFSITAIGSIMLQVAVNSLGTSIVAAVTTANKIQMLFISPLESVGIAMATYCGQNLGAGHIARIKKGIHCALFLVIGYAIVAGVITFMFGGLLPQLFLKPEDFYIIGDIEHFLQINALCYSILGVLFVLRNSLQGLGFSMLPMMAGVSELIARGLVAFILVGVIGYDAVCIAGPVAWVFADVMLIFTYFIKMRWLDTKYGIKKTL